MKPEAEILPSQALLTSLFTEDGGFNWDKVEQMTRNIAGNDATTGLNFGGLELDGPEGEEAADGETGLDFSQLEPGGRLEEWFNNARDGLTNWLGGLGGNLTDRWDILRQAAQRFMPQGQTQGAEAPAHSFWCLVLGQLFFVSCSIRFRSCTRSRTRWC